MGPVLLILLAALWAAVLIPATRGTRNAAYDGRSMQGFHTAMRVLSRRPAQPVYGRTIVVPTVEVTSGATPHLVARRRRLLVRLCWVAGLTLVAAVFLRGPWPWVHGVVDLALVGYVVRLRQLALRRAAAARAARRAALAAHDAALRAAYDEKVAASAATAAAVVPSQPAVRAYDVPARRAVNG